MKYLLLLLTIVGCSLRSATKVRHREYLAHEYATCVKWYGLAQTHADSIVVDLTRPDEFNHGEACFQVKEELDNVNAHSR